MKYTTEMTTLMYVLFFEFLAKLHQCSIMISELYTSLFCLISRDMFNKYQAQRWWTENYDKVMELYNVQRLNRQAFPLPTPPRSEDEVD